jgi:uridine kinase
MCHAEDVFELPNSHDWKLVFDHLFAIRKQSSLEEAEEDHELKDEHESKHESEDVFEHESEL